MKMHNKSIEEQIKINQAQDIIWQSGQFEISGKKVKAIKWIGTQRSAFTHRKDNQRNKIKNMMVKLKKARE